MQEVTVDVAELIEVVKENRSKHRAIFEEALQGYKERALELLREHIERIENGSVEKVFVALPQPEDHTKEYDQVISMLQMTRRAGTKQTVLSYRDYGRYVLDDWEWKDQFLATNSMYAASIQ